MREPGHIIDLRSDTVTKPVPGMRKAMAEAEVGDDVFGDDPTVKILQKRVASILHKEAALFMCSGTMSNQVAVGAHTRPGDEVILDEFCHIFRAECGSAAVLSGVQLHTVPGFHGMITSEQIIRRIRPKDAHNPRSRLVVVENTHNFAGGRIAPLEAMSSVYEVAKSYGLFVHLDGARLFNAAVAKGIPVDRYTAFCDSVSICLSKGLGAPVGSVLAGREEFINEAHRIRKRLGGGMRQVGILAAAGLYALDHHITRLSEDHSNARLLAERLTKVSGLRVKPADVETNIIVIELDDDCPFEAPELLAVLKEYKVLMVPFGHRRLRAVTHLDVNRDDVEYAAEVMEKVLGKVA